MHVRSEGAMADNGEPGPAPGGNGGGAVGPAAHTGGAVGPAAHTGGADRITIFVNNIAYQVDGPSMTGAELKRLAGEPMNRLVIWIKGGSSAQGGDGESVLDDQSVNLVGGMKFRIVNAGAFGRGIGPLRPDAGRRQSRAAPRRPGGVP